MTKLPEIGTIVNIQYYGKKVPVKIVAHFNGGAVYIDTHGSIPRAGWNTHVGFEEIKPASDEQPQGKCEPGNHNYVQIAEAHENSAFCTRCGNIIKL